MYSVMSKITMTINILVTGSSGQLGSELHYLSENELELCQGFSFFFADRKTLDISNQTLIEDYCTRNAITHIINCAAYTAVDKAESEPEKADAINHLAVKNLASVAKANDIALIHISTDYVFDGTNHKPYKETDAPNPQSIYGKTKLLGEQAMQQVNPNRGIIIRTSWVYSSFGNNFVKTMLRLGKERDELNVVVDQIGTPTYARDLARAILQFIPQLNNDCREVKIYHYSNQGVCSWYDFAQAIFQIEGINCQVNAIPSTDYPATVERPFYSVLNKEKVDAVIDTVISHWHRSLLVMLKEKQ